MPKTTAKYEFTMVLNTKLGEEGIAALVEKYTQLISDNGSIEKVEEWGKRKLAYEIEDETEGYYVHFAFTAAPAFPAELNRISGITDGVLRYLAVAIAE